jgi:nucleoside-diphosphate-sugar epimerase
VNYEAVLELRELSEGAGTELVIVRPPLVYGGLLRGCLVVFNFG